MSENKVLQAVKPAYTLRALEAKDVFLMSKIIGAIGLDTIKKSMSADNIRAMVMGKSDAEAVGVAVFLDAAQAILQNLPKCEKDIYSFLAGLSGMDAKEVASLPMNTFIQMIVDVFKKEEFGDFFRLVSSLFK